MKKLILFGAAIGILVSCSKDELKSEPDLAKKSTYEITDDPEQVLTLVQDFIANVDDPQYASSTTQDIDLEYAVWLVEAALNYENRGDGVTAGYVDFSDQTEVGETISYLEDSGVVTTSEEDMFSLFASYRTTAVDYAPFRTSK